MRKKKKKNLWEVKRWYMCLYTYTGRQRNVQLYIYTSNCVWSAPVFFSRTNAVKGNIHTLETWRAITSISYRVWMECLRMKYQDIGWLIDWCGGGARATTSHFQEGEKESQNTEQSGNKKNGWGWISSSLPSFKEKENGERGKEFVCVQYTVQLHTWHVIYSPLPAEKLLSLYKTTPKE